MSDLVFSQSGPNEFISQDNDYVVLKIYPGMWRVSYLGMEFVRAISREVAFGAARTHQAVRKGE